MKRNFLFVTIAALLLAPWPVVYAYEGVDADTQTAIIQPADPAYAPQLEAYGGAVGHVTSGDLFIVDLTGNTVDTRYELIIANADEMVADFRFFNVKIGIFVQGEDENHWNRLTDASGSELPHIYITMHGGITDFTLPGGAKYKVTIDTGCFYCYVTSGGSGIASPEFYITGM